MSNKITVVFGVITELELGGKKHSLILQASAGEQKALKGSLNFTEALAFSDVVNDLKAQIVGDSTLAKKSEDTTSLLKDINLRLNELTLIYEGTRSETQFKFVCSCQLEVFQGNKLNIEIYLSYRKYSNAESFDFEISLALSLSNYQFNLELIKRNNSIFFVAAFKADKQEITVRDLVKCISEELAKDIPESLKIKLNHILFVYCRDNALDRIPKEIQLSQKITDNQILQNSLNSNKFLFGLDLSAKINLSELPLVGQKLPANFTFSLESLKLLLASGDFSEIADLKEQNNSSSAISHLKDIPSLNKGFIISIKMKLAEQEYSFSLPPQKSQKALPPTPKTQPNQTTPQPAQSSTSSPIQPTSDNSTLWYDLEKTFGPMRFKRIGLQWVSAEQTIFLLLDASLSVCNLTVTVDGLAVGYSLKKSEVKYKLRGLAIDYKNSTNTFQLGGAFLWQELTEKEKEIYSFKVAGGLILKTQAFTIAAIGAYAQFKSGDCSILIYAVLDKTLGGYPAFFVTGLALGFGYNRAFKKPELDNLKEFPLVKLAITEDKKAGDLLTGLGTLDSYLPPQQGSFFLAIGVKFTTYKLIDSFLLLVVSLSDKWEFHILGISTLILPPSIANKTLIEPIAKIELGFTATFNPDEGTLKVLGKILPGSYIFSPEVKLSGGFAFYAWFTGEHKGDFVLTLGGYHPDFKVPAHYPQVEGIGFNLANVNGINLSIKGTTYLAVIPSGIMAGGCWEATYNSDTLRASFNANVNLLIAWQPFHYDAWSNLNVHAEHNFTGIGGWETHDVSASLHIWGPEFSGEVKIDLGVTSETFTFGNASKDTPTITWEDFQKSFLPAAEKICNINIKSGLLRTVERTVGKDNIKLGIVNPKEFCLVVESAIPFKEAQTTKNENFEHKASFGIAPMNIKASQLKSSIEINIIEKKSNHKVEDIFEFKAIDKNVPVALWGESKNISLNRNNFIKDARVGFEIEPKQKVNEITPIQLEHKDITKLEKATKDFCWEKFWIEESSKIEKNLLCEFMGLTESEIIFSKSMEIYRDKFKV